METKETKETKEYSNVNLTDNQKREIAKTIKPILLEDALDDLEHLREIVDNHFYDPRTKSKKKGKKGGEEETQKQVNLNYCRVGNNFVDYFTFVERLHTRGKYGIHFYEFLERLDEFKQKKFIQTMFDYYSKVKNKNQTKHSLVVYKEVFNICISSINIIRPIVLCNLFLHFGTPKHILDFNMGWGGAVAAAFACQIPHYTGIDMNTNLRHGYESMILNIDSEKNKTRFDFLWENALNVDYKELPAYDFVFTSPPYFFIETYSHATTYPSKENMVETYYRPIFSKTWEGLQKGGHYCLSINKEIYTNICVSILGEAHEKIPLGRSKRGNPKEGNTIVEYKEWIYVWKK